MSTYYSIDVAGVAPTTSKDQLRDFFAFCGLITSIDYKEGSGKATVTFEKSQAARTALMLSGGALDGSVLTITSDIPLSDEPTGPHHDDDHPVDQSDKPRAGIAAEYLAKGYQLSDHVLKRAIELDNQQGISKRFLNYFQSLDKTIGEKALGPEQTISGKVQTAVDSATQQAKSIDEQKGLTKRAHEYYLQAISSPTGRTIVEFYTNTTKQINDIHEEARRIADAQNASPPTQTDVKVEAKPLV